MTVRSSTSAGGTISSGSVSVAAGGFIDLYNLGGPGDANYEKLTADWSANVARIWTRNDGTGVGRTLRVGVSATDGIGGPEWYTEWAGSGLPRITHSIASTGVAGISHELASTVSAGLAGSSGTQTAVAISPTFAGTGTQGSVGFLVNPSGTAGSGGFLLQSWQLSGTTQAALSSGGTFWATNVLGVSQVGFSSALGVGADLSLVRDAADILAQRRTTSPQTFRIYNTFTDASNFERGFLRWNGNVLQIGTDNAGTGTARTVGIVVGGASTWTFSTSGTMLAATDNSFDIGAAGTNRPRNIFVAGYIRNGVTTVAALPAAATAGQGARMVVSDANAPVFGAAVAGGGAVTVGVISTGAAWNVG